MIDFAESTELVEVKTNFESEIKNMQTREQIPSLFVELQKLTDPLYFWNEFQNPVLRRNEINGISIFENDDQIFLEASVPGVKADQIDISLEKGVVWIQAEAPIEQPKDAMVHLTMDRKYCYRIPLPVKIDEHHPPEAECKDGIVKVTIAKSRSSKPLKINVKGT
jgi:HSP20 family protein